MTIPELTVFFSFLHIRDIDDRKESDLQKKKRRAQEREELGLSEEEEEELKLDLPPIKYTKKGKRIEFEPEVIEEARIKAEFKKELATYGVSTLIIYLMHVVLLLIAHLDLGELLLGQLG